jgi:hypothetical protein
MECCKKCGSRTLFFRRVAALEVTLRKPAYMFESYCPLCAWCGGTIPSLHADERELRRRGQELATT